GERRTASRGLRLDEITRERIVAYQRARLAVDPETGRPQASDSTLGQEIKILRKVFTLAQEAGKYRGAMPRVKVADPNNARTGFFEREELAAVLRRLAAWLRGAIVAA